MIAFGVPMVESSDHSAHAAPVTGAGRSGPTGRRGLSPALDLQVGQWLSGQRGSLAAGRAPRLVTVRLRRREVTSHASPGGPASGDATCGYAGRGAGATAPAPRPGASAPPETGA